MGKKKESIIKTNALLKLDNIKKNYYLSGSDPVEALKGISINFRKNEFVSILGPSGCGKTTLLNIVGGLDKYTDGDLVIAGKSTKNYKDHDWDVYRNHRIGFIFQSYNLIPHQTILENVELALTISGLSKKERIEKAKRALDKVGLKGSYKKHPNQMSGGQCQRVAIARALVNEPDILLADEPTGALDTHTSIQIMNLISEISKEKLVIMVTHNPDIAKTYSNRIINLLDGLVIDDSNPLKEEIDESSNEQYEIKNEKAKMSWFTAFKLSLRNLISKIKRTILVCVAGSIGIVGVSTVLAVSSGIHNYIDNMQDDMLSGNPITITETTYDLSALTSQMNNEEKLEIVKEAGTVGINSVLKSLTDRAKTIDNISVSNDITKEYVDYVLAMDKNSYSAISLDYGLDLSGSIYTDFKYDGTSQAKSMSVMGITSMYNSILNETSFKDYSSYISQLASSFALAPDNNEYILSQYDLLSGRCASGENEVMIVVSKNEQLTDVLMAQLGYYTQLEFQNIAYSCGTEQDKEKVDPALDKYKFSYDELLNKKFRWYPNDQIFTKNENVMTSKNNPYIYSCYEDENFENGLELNVVGILRAKDNISYGCLSSGFYYTSALSKKIIEANKDSEIVKFYRDGETRQDTISSGPYSIDIGGTTMTFNTGITYTYSYTLDGETKDNIVGYYGKESAMSSILGIFSKYMGGSSESTSSTYYQTTLRELGGIDIANNISIYPTNFDNKYLVTDYLDGWNNNIDAKVKEIEDSSLEQDKKDEELSKVGSKVKYTDNLELIIGLINTMIDMVTYALIVFTALSLLVSTVMIGIITYVSVVERVKEIGVIRSLGGRKKDVSHLFNAETFIIGLVSGIFGILITELISLIINLIVGKLTGIYTIADLQIQDASIMIAISIILTLISGLIPAKAAANKNPVDALRTE